MGTIGKYRIVKRIGEGGFAKTYLAEHLLLGEWACIKQNLVTDPEDAKLLLREAKLLWQIHHHSLPTLRDFLDCGDGSFALVMTYVPGKDLWKIVEEDFPDGIDPEHVCWMAQRLLNALHYLHYYGVIHYDVKPQNIIINAKEHNAILVDYGLSSIRPKSTTTGLGYTPAFAAPEQMANLPPIPETDVFGLGVSLIYALGGDYLAKTFPSHVPRKLKEFISKMVLHEPLKRPNDLSILVKELSDLRLELFGHRSSEKVLKIDFGKARPKKRS